MMRKYGQEIIKATAGKKIHGTGAIPGGINKNLSIAERDGFLKDIDQMLTWSRGALEIAKDYTAEHLTELAPISARSTPTTCRWSEPTAPWTSTTATCAPSTPTGSKIFDQVDYQKLPRLHRRGGAPWSYMKFPFIKSLGPEKGWYRVGPLARRQHLRLHRHARGRGRAQGVHGPHGGQAEQHHHGLPLGADDRAAARGREDPGCSCTIRTCRAPTSWSRASAARRRSA